MCWAYVQQAKIVAWEAVHGKGSYKGPRPAGAPGLGKLGEDIYDRARDKAGLTEKGTFICPECGRVRVAKPGQEHCHECDCEGK